jgi:CubicO group peptidase (beta-lactamase class C family)
LAQQAIDSARAAGFEVTEDLSAIGRQLGGSPAQHIVREAEAQAHASAIRMRAGRLVAVDADVARKLAAAIDGLERLEFDDTAVAPRNEKPVIQAVAYAPIPDAPIKDPGVPDDPVGKGPGPTGAGIWSVIDKLPQGNRPFVREVRSAEDLQRLWNWMKEDGAAITDSYRKPGKGVELILPDGTRIGQRLVAGSTGKPVLDARVPGKEYLKVHINPRGGTPELPATPRPQAEPPRPTPQTPTERGGGLPARVFGGGVLPDNTLPHFIEPPQTKESPVIGDGIPDPER